MIWEGISESRAPDGLLQPRGAWRRLLPRRSFWSFGEKNFCVFYFSYADQINLPLISADTCSYALLPSHSCRRSVPALAQGVKPDAVVHPLDQTRTKREDFLKKITGRPQEAWETFSSFKHMRGMGYFGDSQSSGSCSQFCLVLVILVMFLFLQLLRRYDQLCSNPCRTALLKAKFGITPQKWCLNDQNWGLGSSWYK